MLRPTNLHTTPQAAARSVGPDAPEVPTDDGQLARDYDVCREYAVVRARGFGMVREFLPDARQPYSDAHVAFTMYTDDLVDDARCTSAQRAVRFEHLRRIVLSAQDGRADGDELESSLCRAFAHTTATWGIAVESVLGYLDGIGPEVSFSHYATHAEFERYVEEVTARIWSWANAIYGGTSPEADRRARLIAAASQLTDCLLDLREDLACGRLYLPLEDLGRFGVDRRALERAADGGRTPDRIRALVTFEAARARAYFEGGSGWELLVDPSARDAAWATAAFHRFKLDELERSGGDVFGMPPIVAPPMEPSSPPDGRAASDRRPPAQPDRASPRPRAPPRRGAGVPRHVGIVLDGNRRWARANELPLVFGHRRGAAVLREVRDIFLARGVRYISVFVFSTENWNRDTDEVEDLMDLFIDSARDEVDELRAGNIRVRFLGRPEGLPDRLRAAMRRLEEHTAGHDGATLAICLNYGGQTEIVDALRAMLAAGIEADDMTPQAVSEHLYAPEVPPLDLIIRTGGEQRLSNFMLWRAAYAELCFTTKMWPDITPHDIEAMLDDYAARARRFGR